MHKAILQIDKLSGLFQLNVHITVRQRKANNGKIVNLGGWDTPPPNVCPWLCDTNLLLHTVTLTYFVPQVVLKAPKLNRKPNIFRIFRKSTFFNVLTKSAAAAENFPFCTIGTC